MKGAALAVVGAAALVAGFLLGRGTAPESRPAAPVPASAPREDRPPERAPTPPTDSASVPKEPAPPVPAPAIEPERKPRPGLFPVEFKVGKGIVVRGFHDAIPTVEQVRDFVKGGRDAYVRGQATKRIEALKAIFGEEAWRDLALEGRLTSFHEVWAGERWDLHKRCVDEMDALAATAMADEERSGKEREIRLRWAKGTGDSHIEQVRGLSEIIPWSAFRPHEDDIGKVERYGE